MDPFWAAVIGGSVGGITVAIVNAFLNRSGEHQRWLREQRQRGYAEYLDLLNRTYVVQRAALERANRPTGGGLQEHDEHINGTYRELDAAAHRLAIIASRSMLDRAERVVMEWDQFRSVWEDVRDGALDPTELQRQCLSIDDIEAFSEAARREMGAGWDLRHRVTSWYRYRRFWKAHPELRDPPK